MSPRVFATVVLAAPAPALAADGTLQMGAMAMGLAGGLALFLYGLARLTDALQAVAGTGLQAMLARMTGNRVKALLTGAAVTAVIQSSSVTTVMLVGFVSSGLMNLRQTVGVILGADIGTTVTAQLVAFRVSHQSLWLVAAGFLLMSLDRRNHFGRYGQLLLGFGLVLYGMDVMSQAMGPLRDYPPLVDLLHDVGSPWTALALATAFTALVQSSSAAMGVFIALSMQGLVPLETGIALMLGANLGTCVTAALAAIGKPRDAVRVALVHVLFKLVGVVLVIGLIPLFAELVRALSPAGAAGGGMAQFAAEVPRQLANAHTLFNVGVALSCLPLAHLFARLAEHLLPDRPRPEPPGVRPLYLDASLTGVPSLALAAARREVGHVGETVRAMLAQMPQAVFVGNREALARLARLDDEVDALHGAVITYLGEVSRHSLTARESGETLHLMQAANALENIGDVVETELVAIGGTRLARHVEMSPETRQVLAALHQKVSQSVDLALAAVVDDDAEDARRVIAMKRAVQDEVDTALAHQARRLLAAEPGRLEAYRVEVDIIEKLRRIYYFAKLMAKTVVAEETEAEPEDPAPPVAAPQASA